MFLPTLFSFPGKSHDQRVGLPSGTGPYDVRYGLKVTKDCTAGELVSPQKSYKQVEKETKEGQELYKKSHSAYEAGLKSYVPYLISSLNFKERQL